MTDGTSQTPPRFAVVIPTYNRSRVLPRAIDSVLRQTETDLELVVVVDGATDDTLDVLAGIRDPRLRVEVQENHGVSIARNRGVQRSTAPLVAFLDDDDEVRPTWLARLGECLVDPKCPAACCGQQDVAGVLMPTGETWAESDQLFRGGCFLVRRELLEAVGGFMPGLAYAEHTELGFRLIDEVSTRRGHIGRVHEGLLIRHPELSGSAKQHRAEAVLQVIERHRARFEAYPELLGRWLAIAGVARARADDLSGARALFLRAWRAHPLKLRHLLRWAGTWAPARIRSRWDLRTKS